jgi:hypothetical protein
MNQLYKNYSQTLKLYSLTPEEIKIVEEEITK